MAALETIPEAEMIIRDSGMDQAISAVIYGFP